MAEPIHLDLHQLGKVSRPSPTVLACFAEAGSVMLNLVGFKAARILVEEWEQ